MLVQSLEIAKTNWRHNLLPHFVMGVLLLLAAPAIMGVKNLEEQDVARVVDMYLSFLGILLFIPAFLPDGNRDIRDLTASKKTPITYVRAVRLLQAFFSVALLLVLFLYALKLGDCHFAFGTFYYAAVADCVALGGLGILCYGITDNLVLGYMAPVIYYVASMGVHKYMKKFWLMSLLKPGGEVTAEDKIYILSAGLCMMAAGLYIKWKRRA